MNIRIAREIDKEVWNEFVSAQPAASVFHRWEWGNLADLYNHKRFYLISEEGPPEADRVVGVLPLVFIKSLIFGRQLISLPFCEYGGPLVGESASSAAGALVDRALEIARDNRAGSVEFCGVPRKISSAVEGRGFKPLGKNITFKLDLTLGKETVWEGLEGGRVRTAVRKAEKRGVVLVEATSLEDVEDYYHLRLLTEKRHGSPPHSFEFYKKIWEGFFGEGLMKLNFAECQGERVAAIIFFPFQDKILYWSSVASGAARKVDASTFLVWKAIEWGCENGLRIFDMGRTRPGTGVYSYKKSFGAAEEPLNDYVWSPSGTVKIPPDPDKGVYQALTQLWSKLPIPVARVLGPYIVKDIGL